MLHKRKRRLVAALPVIAIPIGWLLLVEPADAQIAFQQPDIVSMYLFNGADEPTFKRQLEQQTDLRIARIAEVVQLDPQQRRKLELAVQGDFSRFYREIARVRKETAGLNVRVQADMQKAWQSVMPLQQKIQQGLLDEDSLFDKVLRSMLTDVQQVKFDDSARRRKLAHFKSILRMTIADLEKSLPLTAVQRQQLIKLVEEGKFPRSSQPNYDVYVGFALLGRLKDDQTKQILDEHQQKTFAQLKQQYAAYAGGFQW